MKEMAMSKPMEIQGSGLYIKCVLTVIAILLAVIAFRPLLSPASVSAESDYGHLYIEPRTTTLRSPDGSQQIEGKVVIDMRNGNVWGFPTQSSAPYPVDTLHNEPPVSTPMYLGKFDFSKITLREPAGK
jgi:hypothetical protein